MVNDHTLPEWKRLAIEGIAKELDRLKELVTSSWEPVFTTKTVDQLLFGYEDNLLNLIHKLDSSINPIFSFAVSIHQPFARLLINCLEIKIDMFQSVYLL